MSFRYSPFPSEEEEQARNRLYATAPGLASWLFLGVLVSSILVAPQVGSGLTIAFLLYYLLRVLHHGFFLVLAFLRIWGEEESPWLERIRELQKAAVAPEEPAEEGIGRRPGSASESLRERYGHRMHRKVMEAVRVQEQGVPPLEAIGHVVIIPVYNESRAVFEPGIASLAENVLDPGRHMAVVIAYEERSPVETKHAVQEILEEYRDRFRGMVAVEHPAGVEGEVPGKASNVGHAAREIAPLLGEWGFESATTLLTVIDADAVPSRNYFAALTYYFMAEPNRERSCYQPIPVFSNNIWRVPALVRIIEMGATVLQLIDSTNPELLITFSSYSYSFKALEESGFWPADIVAEDAGVYWKTFVHFNGSFGATPLPVTVSMDAAEGSSMWETIKATYKQKLRWAYGVENIPIVMRAALDHGMLSGPIRRRILLKLFEMNLTWATWPIILTVVTMIPTIMLATSLQTPLALFNLSRIAAVIFQLSGVFMLLLVLVSGFFVYRESKGVPLLRKLLYPLEWFLLLPISTFLFSGLPALHAQTMLLLGKPLVYRAMEKVR